MSGDPVREQRARWQRKRGRAARELLETELSYLEQLHRVDTFFVAILRAKGTLKPAQRQAVFGPWESIRSASQELLPHLEKAHWGAGLQSFCPHLPLYISYAANREQAKTTLQERLQKSKQFRRFVKLQEGRPEFGGLRLEELLLLPLQRLQQYEALTEALAENTSPGSPDYQQLSRAARSVAEAARQVRAIAREQENVQQLRRIQGLLSGRQAKGLTTGRWFLRQGWLLEVPARGEPRPRMFFLFSDALLMATPRSLLHPLYAGTFSCRALYPLAQCRLDRVFGHTGGCGGLLSLSFPHEKLLLMSTDPKELAQWYQSLAAVTRNSVPIQELDRGEDQVGGLERHPPALPGLTLM
ncbi:rho guanine nucleotide exchange factor 39 isoform X1 [Ornithorhynchus anatinus]|uniref:rho guanine nucleotide exchange factor 39 isoform X1 n=1 Tax=Ornithorhynchus anatinus TaxID=9258 RepID=UPI0010A7ED47|nr:rho guanine nucleotide exchange factor 39 isoform X1 [Ornithorhynchus anatinus]